MILSSSNRAATIYPQEAKLENDEIVVVDYPEQTASKLVLAPKDLRVAHLRAKDIGICV